MHSNWLIPLALGMVGGAYLTKICPKVNSIVNDTTKKAKNKLCDCMEQSEDNQDEQY